MSPMNRIPSRGTKFDHFEINRGLGRPAKTIPLRFDMFGAAPVLLWYRGGQFVGRGATVDMITGTIFSIPSLHVPRERCSFLPPRVNACLPAISFHQLNGMCVIWLSLRLHHRILIVVAYVRNRSCDSSASLLLTTSFRGRLLNFFFPPTYPLVPLTSFSGGHGWSHALVKPTRLTFRVIARTKFRK